MRMNTIGLPFERVVLLLRSQTAEALAPGRIHVRHVPGWVCEYGVAASTDALWIWLAGAPGSVTGPEPMGQAVLDLPEGRYSVEVLDAESGACLSRESTAAPPLVIGVPHAGGPVIVRIEAPHRRRRVSDGCGCA
jgi:hypothetical protein